MKRLVIMMLLTMLGCTSGVSVPSPEPSPTTPVMTSIPTSTPEPIFSGEAAYRHAEAQVAIGPRPTGTDAAFRTAEYIRIEAEAVGYGVVYQEFTYLDRTVRNVIAQPGGVTDTPHIILGAHYDTRLEADEDPSQPTVPVIGANDGASGVAVLLELARVLDTSNLPYDVRLVFFDAEDNGRIDQWDWIVGSSYYVENMAQPPEYVIIVDMIGDADQNIYREINSADHLTDQLWATAAELGFEGYFINEDKYSILDDHTPFLRQGITAANIIDFDYPYWHTTEDTLDKVSAESLGRVGRVVEVFLERGGLQ